MKISVREAKANFSKYGDLAQQGEEIIVTKNGKDWCALSPIVQKTKRDLSPLPGITPTISEEEAVAPLDPEDLEGWI